MILSKELLEQAKSAKSAEDILAAAAEKGIKLSAEEAEKYYTQLHQEGAVADDELDNVSGGCMDVEDVRSTDLKCSNTSCLISVYGRAFLGYYGPDYTCDCSTCGQGKLYVVGWTTQDGSYYSN